MCLYLLFSLDHHLTDAKEFADMTIVEVIGTPACIVERTAVLTVGCKTKYAELIAADVTGQLRATGSQQTLPRNLVAGTTFFDLHLGCLVPSISD